MLNFERVHEVICQELGEGGAEAIQSAIEFFLGNCPDDAWACEEDKLILLMYLFSDRPSLIYGRYNPLLHFSILFDCKYVPDQEAAE